MNDRRRFRNFGSGSVFNCRCCGRRTREAGQAIGIELCPQCYEIAGYDNMVNDNGYEPGSKRYASALAACEQMLAVIAKRGGNIETVKAQNGYIWR